MIFNIKLKRIGSIRKVNVENTLTGQELYFFTTYAQMYHYISSV